MDEGAEEMEETDDRPERGGDQGECAFDERSGVTLMATTAKVVRTVTTPGNRGDCAEM